MYFFAYVLLLIGMLSAIGGAATALFQLAQNKSMDLGIVEKANGLVALCLFVSSGILIYALVSYDFSLEYVAGYTDLTLPLFYRLTAFWAGQAGSLLFWALMVGLCGFAFQFTKSYSELSKSTKLWYWVFFLAIMAFFGLLLTGWSNPFRMYSPVPADGRGLNPLLQNPGMIIHPPLLFLGYGGFVIPGCLALAQAMSGGHNEESWLQVARPFTLTAWLFLTAGIVLGAWWAYMELGWGGYWAWDPVENASLLPWLIGTAALHTGIVETKRGKLRRVNIFLMSLTTVSAFFATYLVRGNVVDSVHAFGEGGVGTALLLFVLGSTALITLISVLGKDPQAQELEGLETREGFLVMTSWLLLALSVVILLATLWPVISSLWTDKAVGLDAGFYNRVCLPLFTVLLALLAICPWLKWQGGVRNWRKLGIVVAVGIVALCGQWYLGYREPLALIGGMVSFAALAGALMCMLNKSTWSNGPTLAAYGVHVGIALMALGVTFSGPYKQEVEVELGVGQTVEVGPYHVTVKELYEGNSATFKFLEAELLVRSKGQSEGGTIVSPQRRIYTKFDSNAYAEAATLPSLGTEFYATLLGLDSEQRAVMRLSANPLVNWLWIGGILMCLFPLLGLNRRVPRRKNDESKAG